MNYNMIDIILVVFALLFVVNGFRRGFIMSLFNLIGTIIAFFAALKFTYVVQTVFLNQTNIFEFIYKNIVTRVSSMMELIPVKGLNLETIFKGYSKLPFDIQKMLDEYLIKSNILISPVNYSDVLAEKITGIIIYALSFIVTFLVAYLLLMIVAGILNTLFKAPILNLANRFLGGVLGLGKAVVIIYIIFALASPFIVISETSNPLTTAIIESKASEVFLENNIILNYLSYKGVVINQ
jgi:uncharacterized membrane protein required for colicin V production